MIKIGMTGTRNTITWLQEDGARRYFQEVDKGLGIHSQFHHGDCVGADARVGEIYRETVKPELRYTIVHPPVKDDLRAWAPYDEIRKPLSYFARNRNIVDETDVLWVFPRLDIREERGGTWYTHDYAAKKGKPRIVFWPNGSITSVH